MEFIIGLIIIFVFGIIYVGSSKSPPPRLPNIDSSKTQNQINQPNSDKNKKNVSSEQARHKIHNENDIEEKSFTRSVPQNKISSSQKPISDVLEITLTPGGLLNSNERYTRSQVLKSSKNVILTIVHQNDNPYDQKAIRVYHDNIFIGYVTKKFTEGSVDRFCFEDQFLKTNICLNWNGNTFLLIKSLKQLLVKPTMAARVNRINEFVSSNSTREIKPNWRDFQKILNQNYITTLYHFTDMSNINSIHNNGGLYSWFYMENKGIQIPTPGGNQFSRQLDRQKGLQDYVRLSFNTHQPMMYIAKKDHRIKDPRILKIDPQVIYWNTTNFSNLNATDNNAEVGNNISNFKNIRFTIAKQNKYYEDEIERKLVQAEVLVKTHIPIEFITF